MVTNELTFYLAAAALIVLTVESCIKLLNRDSFAVTLAVYVTVFGWYFVDPFINPEQYDYIPPFLISQSYGQVLLFLIAFRFFMPVAVGWIVRRRSTTVWGTQRFAPEQMLIAAGGIWLLLLVIGIARMGGDVIGALFPLFYGRHPLVLKLAILAVAFICLDNGFKLVTAFRGTASGICWLLSIRTSLSMKICDRAG